MNTITRRKFIQNSSRGASGVALSGFSQNIFKKVPPLSLSSIAFSDWEFTKFMDFNAKVGYQAIEIKGIQTELDLTKRATDIPF